MHAFLWSVPDQNLDASSNRPINSKHVARILWNRNPSFTSVGDVLILDEIFELQVFALHAAIEPVQVRVRLPRTVGQGPSNVVPDQQPHNTPQH